MFYTYAHYTPQGRLFYIGKGQGERAHSKLGRNKYWSSVVKKYGKPDVQILAHWDTEKEAFSHEILLIDCFKELGHKLCNMTNGGEGTVGLQFSEEHKEKLSKAKLGKTPWNKGKKGLPTWNKGIPCKEETKLKLSVINMGHAGHKHSDETKNRIRTANLGNKKPLRYKMIGTNKDTGEQIILLGTKALKEAGFTPTVVRECAKGNRKSHKGFTWVKESLENK